MKKEIVVSIIGGIALTILITLSAGWFNNQKKEIVDSIISIVDKKTSIITDEIKKERCSRAELAATLLKSGVEIPTKLLISFSQADTNPEAEKVFLSSIITANTTVENDVVLKNKLDKFHRNGLDVAYLSKMNDGHVLMAVGKSKDVIRGIGGIKAESTSIVHVGTVEFKSIEVDNTINLLKNSDFTTGQIFVIKENNIKFDEANKNDVLLKSRSRKVMSSF